MVFSQYRRYPLGILSHQRSFEVRQIFVNYTSVLGFVYPKPVCSFVVLRRYRVAVNGTVIYDVIDRKFIVGIFRSDIFVKLLLACQSIDRRTENDRRTQKAYDSTSDRRRYGDPLFLCLRNETPENDTDQGHRCHHCERNDAPLSFKKNE